MISGPESMSLCNFKVFFCSSKYKQPMIVWDLVLPLNQGNIPILFSEEEESILIFLWI